MNMNKSLDVTSTEDLKNKVSDVEVFGNPDTWRLICKASSESQGWMKSTKAMIIEDLGVLVQVTTQQGGQIAEALQFIPGACVVKHPNGELQIVLPSKVERRMLNLEVKAGERS